MSYFNCLFRTCQLVILSLNIPNPKCFRIENFLNIVSKPSKLILDFGFLIRDIQHACKIKYCFS